MVEYTEALDGVTAGELQGFFVGWRNVPTPAQHLAMLRGSTHVVLARDGARVAGFVMPHVQDAGAWLTEFDAALADDPAMRGCGDHIIGVVQIT